MALHGLTHFVMGVPRPQETIDYYAQFGLDHDGHGVLSTQDAGEQLRIVYAPTRRLLELGVGADDADDLMRIASTLGGLGLASELHGDSLRAREPVSDFGVVVSVRSRLVQPQVSAPPYNGPGRVDRAGRAPGVVRSGPVKPRKLGHVVVGTTNLAATMSFFTDGLGFRMSDYIGDKGAFMRCSSDHHNVLALAAPVNFLHHSSWQVDDIDDVGRGASAMLEGNPERHVWGLGRHHAGSNFFWYLKDPAGNFSEYYADMDCIPEDELWKPEVFEGTQGLFEWGPPPPPSFLAPEDLASLMTGQHSAR